MKRFLVLSIVSLALFVGCRQSELEPQRMQAEKIIVHGFGEKIRIYIVELDRSKYVVVDGGGGIAICPKQKE